MKAFDVVGTTHYITAVPDSNDEWDALFNDCGIVLSAAFIDSTLMDVSYIGYGDSNDEERHVEIDWILTVIADSEEQVRTWLASSKEVFKQWSDIYEITDVTDDVTGIWANKLKGECV